ncbi:MAG: 1-phosphofructokinase [Treponema sp.]
MIYTVTVNPSLDYIAGVPRFTPGVVNRTESETINAGGKGINVSIMLRHLGLESIALGFIAGFTGEQVRTLLTDQGVSSDFTQIARGFSRINVKLKGEVETEINGQGPIITENDLARLFEKLEPLGDDDILVLSGSIPASVPQTLYRDIMTRFSSRKTKIVVDATRDLLKNVLECRPFLIKPNNIELGELFGAELTTRDDVIPYAKKLQAMGARNVLVSMAGKGAVFAAETGEVYQSDAPKGKKVNSVGAGDSMVAGFLAGYLTTGSYVEAFKMGLCAGSASAFSEHLADKQAVDALRASCRFDF